MSNTEFDKLRVDPYIAQSPIYRGGKSMASVQEKYQLDHIDKLGSNENPLPTPPSVQDAIAAVLTGLNRYPPGSDLELRENLAAYFGRGVTPDHFVSGNAGCDLLNLIAIAFIQPGDEAIICRPTFPVYELTLKRRGATMIYADLDDHFHYDVDKILAAVTPKTRLLYLTSPNNPTGTLLRQQQLDRLMQTLPSHVLVVADEVYFHFNTDPEMADSLAYVLQNRNLVILHTFSKVFGLAGMRLGYLIGAPALIDYISRTRLPFHTNSLSLVAANAGLNDRDYVEETVSMTIEQRSRLYHALNEIDGVTVFPSEANFLLIKPEFDSQVVDEALQKRGTIVRPLDRFYMPGYLRVSVGRPAENDRFLENFKAVLQELAS